MSSLSPARCLALLPALVLACSPDGGDDTGASATDGAATTTDGATTDGSTTADASDTGVPTTTDADTGTSATGGDTGEQGWPDPEDAPSYDGAAFAGMQIYEVATGLWLAEEALMAGLAPAQVVYVGEQHEVAAIQELELWVLQRVLAGEAPVALGMEHFQRDEQPVIDDYLAGEIDGATFEADAQPWDNYAKYWKPLVEAMKAAKRPVLGLNVPSEALEGVYAKFPERPLDVFNGWGESHPFDADLPPRPLAPWTASYQEYFDASFDASAHGEGWGLSPEETLDYFTDLALIRDDTMGFWISEHVAATGDKVVVVAGDWHVQTGLATPDSAGKFGELSAARITTATPTTLDTVLAQSFSDRPVADYVLVYTPQ